MTLPNDQRPTGDSGRPGNSDRRIQIVSNPEVRDILVEEHDVGPAERRRQTILPGEDGGRARRVAASDKQPLPESEGPILALDPALAATRRARVRAEALSRMQLLEDTSMPDDLAAAEEEYDEPEELYNETGIPIEPFHLRAEREAGYFDAEGNYLEYRLDAEDTDAWLESVMDEHRQVRADPELLARRRRAALAGKGSKPAAASSDVPFAGAGTAKGRRQRAVGGATGAADADAAAPDADTDEEDDTADDDEGPFDMHMLEDTGAVLGDDERAVYQKRVADLLQLGETPLDGLRRLGKLMHTEGSAAGGGGGGGGAAGAGVPADAEAAAAGADGAMRPGGFAADEGGGGGGDGDGGSAVGAAAAKADVGASAAAGERAVVGGGGSFTLAQLSCGERQRLRKMRRENQGTAAPPPPPTAQPPPERRQAEVRYQVEGRRHQEHQPQQQLPEEGTRRTGVDVEMDDAAVGTTAAPEPAPEPKQEAEQEADARPGDAPPSPAARQSVAEAAAAAAARRRAPAGPLPAETREARRQFDSLTSYANLLLSAGMFDVYGSTREQLLRAAQRTLGVDVVRSLTVAGLRPVGQAAPPKRAAAGNAAAAATGDKTTAGKRRRQLAEAPTEGAAEAASDGGPADAAGAAAAGPAPQGAVAAAAAVDADVDMFGDDGDEDKPGVAVAASASAAAKSASSPPPAAAAGEADPTAAPSASQRNGGGSDMAEISSSNPVSQGHVVSSAPAAGKTDVGARATHHGDGGGGERPEPGPGSAAVEAAATTQGSLLARGGFELDPDSGYLYSSQLGYYYDNTTGMYGDANTGLWYRHVGGFEGTADGGGTDAQGEGAAVPGLFAAGRFELVTTAEQQQQQQQQQDRQEQQEGQQPDGQKQVGET